MIHLSQKYFFGVFVGITQHQKEYLVYILITSKICSSHAVIFYENFSSVLEYTSRPYSDALATRPSVVYIPYATLSNEQTWSCGWQAQKPNITAVCL